MTEIKEIAPTEALKIIETREPKGLFILPESPDDTCPPWTGVDNSTGDANVESWPTRELCELWLRGQIEPPYLSHAGEFPVMEEKMRAAGIEPDFGNPTPDSEQLTTKHA